MSILRDITIIRFYASTLSKRINRNFSQNKHNLTTLRLV